MLTRHIDDDNADDADLRARLEAVESLAAKWEAQMVPASIYAAQLRALLAPAAKAIPLGKYLPCGCVLCTCEDDERCHGCGAKLCADHAKAPEQLRALLARRAPDADLRSRLEAYLNGRRAVIEQSIAAERLAGREDRVWAENQALAEITAMECELCILRVTAHAPEPPKPITDGVTVAGKCPKCGNWDTQCNCFFRPETPMPEPPKCEECEFYGVTYNLGSCSNIDETFLEWVRARSTDGACGPEGRLFVRKGEVKT
jgi:hypothetical protein